jgi:hypothetical protein
MNLSARAQKTPIQQQSILGRPAHRKVQLPLQVTHHLFVGTRRTECVCTDINEHGMGVDIPQPLSVGEIVRLELGLPSDRFDAFARVIYRNSYHCGLYFVDLDPEQRQKLAKILAERQSGSKDLLQ